MGALPRRSSSDVLEKSTDPEPVPCQTVYELLSVISSELRFEFLRSLAQGPKTVSELAHELALRQPCTSQHLAILRKAALVEYEQQKKDRVYRLSDEVRVSIEGGQVFLSIKCNDGDSVLIRTQIPFCKPAPQSVLWPWASEIPPSDRIAHQSPTTAAET